ncbi:MAG: agmatine deiminase family protein [Bacteroidales bacterium]|jgi:agmatine deiminase|nr:agmatine deiminase family protein [Bacteroidales bacterium]
MITDHETNFVYFSSLIKENEKFAPFWKRLDPILIEHQLGVGFIENTRDIWCRDYMPIQINTNDFVQFEFFPNYLIQPKYINRLTIPTETKIIDRINKRFSKLIVDGGNIVKYKNTAILTEKVIKENSNREPETVISILKKDLKVENIFLLPVQPGDISGHADGMVRFLDEKSLLVSDYSYESQSWCKKMDEALEKTGLKIIKFPSESVEEKNMDGDWVAKGVYINFAQIGNLILFPQFGLKTDKIALDRTKELYPDCKVIPIDSNEIAEGGGVLNCITWNIKIEPLASFNKLPKKTPSHIEQEKFVFERLDFYLSTHDYKAIAKGFEIAWNKNIGKNVGDGNFKNMTYHFLEYVITKNHIPQKIVDTTIDLILEYMESIGQWGYDISEN